MDGLHSVTVSQSSINVIQWDFHMVSPFSQGLLRSPCSRNAGSDWFFFSFFFFLLKRWCLFSSLLFSGNICFLLGQIYSSEVQQHSWVSMVGICTWVVVYSLFDTHGSFLDDLQDQHHSWYTATGKNITFMKESTCLQKARIWDLCMYFWLISIKAYFLIFFFRGSPYYALLLKTCVWNNQKRKRLNCPSYPQLLRA